MSAASWWMHRATSTRLTAATSASRCSTTTARRRCPVHPPRCCGHWRTGPGPCPSGQFANVRSIVVDAQGNVYAADGGNKRIQVFDNNGTFKTQWTGVGNTQALCITPGPNQVIYSSNSNAPNDIDIG